LLLAPQDAALLVALLLTSQQAGLLLAPWDAALLVALLLTVSSIAVSTPVSIGSSSESSESKERHVTLHKYSWSFTIVPQRLCTQCNRVVWPCNWITGCSGNRPHEMEAVAEAARSCRCVI
jgi:hypothetical protein